MAKIGILGGSFDPVHNGHLYFADAAISRLGLDRLLLLPARRPPHKQGTLETPGAHRLAMCRLACDGERITADGLELEGHGTGYTVDTLAVLSRGYRGDQLYLLLGSDAFLSLRRWKGLERILREAVVVTAPRSPGEIPFLEQEQAFLQSYAGRTVVLDIPPLSVSSSLVRRMAARGRDLNAYLPQGVADYIRRHQLYGSPASGTDRADCQG